MVEVGWLKMFLMSIRATALNRVEPVFLTVRLNWGLEKESIRQIERLKRQGEADRLSILAKWLVGLVLETVNKMLLPMELKVLVPVLGIRPRLELLKRKVK